MNQIEDEKKRNNDLLYTVEQGRASFAYKRVNDTVGQPWSSEYKSYLKKLPMYIKTNGLGATFAFIFNKKGNEGKKRAYQRIYEDCTEWLKADPKEIFNIGNKELMLYILELKSPEYRALTNEIIALAKWMGRFADGLIIE